MPATSSYACFHLRVLDDKNDKTQQDQRHEREYAALGPRIALELLGTAELVEA